MEIGRKRIDHYANIFGGQTYAETSVGRLVINIKMSIEECKSYYLQQYIVNQCLIRYK